MEYRDLKVLIALIGRLQGINDLMGETGERIRIEVASRSIYQAHTRFDGIQVLLGTIPIEVLNKEPIWSR